jgi:hypothetical protein
MAQEATMTSSLDRLYVIGAGASIPYGLPLLKRLAFYVREAIPDDDRAVFDMAIFEAYGDKMLSPTSSVDFEDFLNRLDPIGLSYLDDQDLGQPLQNRKHVYQVALSGLRSYMQTKCENNKDTSGPYDRLVANRSASEAFVSFNWDVLLERAITRARQEYAYLPTPHASGKRIVLKPHGSINWQALLDRECLMVSSQSNLCCVGDDISYYLLYRPDPFSPIDFRYSLVEYALSKVPAIVPPQSSKLLSVGGSPRDDFVEAGHLRVMKAIWKEFLNYVRIAREIVVIGYSLPGTDAAAITLLKAGLATRKTPIDRIILVDPNEEIPDRYETLLRIKVYLSCKKVEDFDPSHP